MSTKPSSKQSRTDLILNVILLAVSVIYFGLLIIGKFAFPAGNRLNNLKGYSYHKRYAPVPYKKCFVEGQTASGSWPKWNPQQSILHLPSSYRITHSMKTRPYYGFAMSALPNCL